MDNMGELKKYLEEKGMTDLDNISSSEAEQMINMLKNVKLKINTEAKPSEKKSTSNFCLLFLIFKRK